MMPRPCMMAHHFYAKILEHRCAIKRISTWSIMMLTATAGLHSGNQAIDLTGVHWSEEQEGPESVCASGVLSNLYTVVLCIAKGRGATMHAYASPQTCR